MNDSMTIASLEGPWVDPDFDSGLIERCRNAWNKPLKELSNQELATLLRQKIAVQHLLPIARQRIADSEAGTEERTRSKARIGTDGGDSSQDSHQQSASVSVFSNRDTGADSKINLGRSQ